MTYTSTNYRQLIRLPSGTWLEYESIKGVIPPGIVKSARVLLAGHEIEISEADYESLDIWLNSTAEFVDAGEPEDASIAVLGYLAEFPGSTPNEVGIGARVDMPSSELKLLELSGKVTHGLRPDGITGFYITDKGLDSISLDVTE